MAKQSLPTKATLKALDALNYGEHVSAATRARLVREGLVTEGGRLTDLGQEALDRRLAHEVLGRDHATKKSTAQLESEIADLMGAKPINGRKTVRHFSESKDKNGKVRLSVVYEDLTSHPITPGALERYREREGSGSTLKKRRYR